ncbi:hypothetical protein CDL12_27190 [Handroanthus impetiginosus]|uniref:Bifunctional inhibitor/plant lipid transfer protein/seed storage helical domain-containing protein n=1 Tax=Handroanthus impetiginosus TaxID=429701 RepID=A0A2G9G587_9LAMI|nr:hypothetical protein CDL12_27190 [Handroanthus impetiginosus]
MMKSITSMVLIAAAVVAAVAPPVEAAIGYSSGFVLQSIMAKMTSDRQSVCNCLKSMAKSYPGVNLDKIARLPSQCGVNIPYKISPSTNCVK